MQDLMMDIFILCLIANKKGSEEFHHCYMNDHLSIFKHVDDKCYMCSADSIREANQIKEYLEAVINDTKRNESIWQ